MAAGAYFIIPIGPVPIVLQNMFVLLAGLLLGPGWGAASVALYLLLGMLGLPVFSAGGGGIGHLLGPTGGYLAGYLPAVFTVGAISRAGWRGSRRRSMAIDVLAAVCGSLIVYLCGVLWLQRVAGLTLPQAVAAGALPFLPGDALKIAAAVAVAGYARPLVARSAPAAPPAGGGKS
jgi:biotin transport system substrate-specific component